jgi:3-hydroxymyristoyl/3-hydroxydecanoyl-(acyl carrier protein) dehydratase/NAD(P)-dependent dehydrogenase (short-subunit alcohol dehydrogenase family)
MRGVKLSLLTGKDILVIGAREGGYGASIARAALKAGARVFGTTLDPKDPRERSFFEDLGAILIDSPLKYDADARRRVLDDLSRVEAELREHGVERLDAIIHAVAGGFPRQPSVMKAVGDILKGKRTFADMATPVKRNVYYVNAGSFSDTVNALEGLIAHDTHLVGLSYRGDLPYFISDTKAYLERLGVRLARQGKRSLMAAMPEAWTQSSQFFTGIEIAVVHNYLLHLSEGQTASEQGRALLDRLKEELDQIDGFPEALEKMRAFSSEKWKGVSAASNPSEVYEKANQLLTRMRKEGGFSALRRAVEVISKHVREASAEVLVREFLVRGRYEPGDVRQITYRDLIADGPINKAQPREKRHRTETKVRQWLVYEKDEIRRTLRMYGKDFLFLDRVVMEVADEIYDGGMGFGCFTVPSPDQSPIMKDHFVGTPLFGGHLQMEAVAQFGTFMILKCLEDKKTFPILTGTEFPDLNTMAPPGEKLTMMGVISVPERRNLVFEAFIENRYARSRGTIKGMILPERVVRKMLSSFGKPEEE